MGNTDEVVADRVRKSQLLKRRTCKELVAAESLRDIELKIFHISIWHELR